MSLDSPDINTSHSGSRLLSLDSPVFPSDLSHSQTGPGGDDLSISELSLSSPDSILSKPFSLLARFDPKPLPPTIPNYAEDLSESTPTRGSLKSGPAPETREAALANEDGAHGGDVEVQQEDEDEEVVRQRAQEKRDEKLKSDIFILKKLNAAFELFHDSLEEVGSANERVGAQIAETDALLNKYIKILSKSEEFSRFIFDEQWYGAEADEEEFVRQNREEEERALRAAEEKARREREEQERLEREKEERERREEKERVEREKSERAIRGGLRGIRGTRSSTAASSRGKGTGSSRGGASTTIGSSRGGIPKRPPSSSSSVAGGSGIPRVSYRPS